MTSWFCRWEADKTAEASGQQGMPSALVNNVPRQRQSLLVPQNESRQMDGEGDVAQKRPAICPTDEETVALEKKRIALCPTDNEDSILEKKKPHKQSFEYIWRTGVAGGLAGSAVCL